MVAGKTSPFQGRWHIVSMTEWDEAYLNEEVQAFIELGSNQLGEFQFGYVQGQIDWVAEPRDGSPAVEWSWEGEDGADGTQLSGRGWAKLEEGELRGKLFIHTGDNSGFVARRAGSPGRARKGKA